MSRKGRTATRTPEHWHKRCELKRPFVAVANCRIAGFLELDPDGHIDCAYINPDFQRCGIMTALRERAVWTRFDFHLPRVRVEASIYARPLFEKAGFPVVRENRINLGGAALRDFSMERLKPD